jgi:DNA-binding IclR family transcriptional regulator
LRLRRDVGEDQSAFGARVRSAAVAMLTGGARVAIAVAVEGSESRADAESNR